MTRKRWTADEMEILRREYADTPTTVLAARLSAAVAAVYRKARSMGLRKSGAYLASPSAGRLRHGNKNGADTTFKPGHRPHNKGKKGWQAGGKARATQFKPGNRSGRAAALYHPIGTERLSDDGYLRRKVNDDIPLQRRWKAVHVIMWEEAHGPIPKGHAVAFKNRNKQDIRLDNLELISRRELMARNSIHNLPEELADVCRLKGTLQRQINKRMRNEKQD